MRQIVLFLLMAGFLSKTSLAQVPDFTQTDCNGVTYRLYDELAAGNAVVLKFCAMWCGPCAVSNPEYQKAWESLGEGNCKVKMFSMMYEDFDFNITDCDDGISYANQYGLTMPTLTNIGNFSTGLTAQYAAKYNIQGIPTTLVILPNPQDPANSTVEIIEGALPNLSEWIQSKLALGGFANSITAVGELCSNPPFS
ncbi:MAG TPA: redoxin domain-containing protein, partial [Chitinophagaceae bacterium]